MGSEVHISGDLRYDSYLIISTHPSDGTLFYGILSGDLKYGNKVFILKQSTSIKITQGTVSSPIKIKIDDYSWVELYFVPIGFHNKKLNIEIIKPVSSTPAFR